jgi:hypothetical protein
VIGTAKGIVAVCGDMSKAAPTDAKTLTAVSSKAAKLITRAQSILSADYGPATVPPTPARRGRGG